MANTLPTELDKNIVIGSRQGGGTVFIGSDGWMNEPLGIVEYHSGAEINGDPSGRLSDYPPQWINRSYSNHLDTKYPHICFKCKRNLKFEELFNANRGRCNVKFYDERKKFDVGLYRELKQLWKSQVVEFYCCFCFNLVDNKEGMKGAFIFP